MDNECLVLKARRECPCEWCKLFRKNDEFIINWIIQREVREIFGKIIREEINSTSNSQEKIKVNPSSVTKSDRAGIQTLDSNAHNVTTSANDTKTLDTIHKNCEQETDWSKIPCSCIFKPNGQKSYTCDRCKHLKEQKGCGKTFQSGRDLAGYPMYSICGKDGVLCPKCKESVTEEK